VVIGRVLAQGLPAQLRTRQQAGDPSLERAEPCPFSLGPESALELEMVLTLDPVQPAVTVSHRIVIRGPWAIELAPWSISIMAPGGRVVLPQEPRRGHPDAFGPARPVVL